MTMPRFIAVEGPDGVGKTTQCRAIAKDLRERGIQTLVTREPGGTRVGKAIRRMTVRGTTGDLGPATEVLLFCAARVEHWNRTIGPALEKGTTVICDRFHLSTYAYQKATYGGMEGLAVNLMLECLWDAPDATIVLLPKKYAGKRTNGHDRFESRSDSYHRRLHNAFARMCRQEHDHTRIDCDAPRKVVTEEIMQALGFSARPGRASATERGTGTNEAAIISEERRRRRARRTATAGPTERAT